MERLIQKRRPVVYMNHGGSHHLSWTPTPSPSAHSQTSLQGTTRLRQEESTRSITTKPATCTLQTLAFTWVPHCPCPCRRTLYTQDLPLTCTSSIPICLTPNLSNKRISFRRSSPLRRARLCTKTRDTSQWKDHPKTTWKWTRE